MNIEQRKDEFPDVRAMWRDFEKESTQDMVQRRNIEIEIFYTSEFGPKYLNVLDDSLLIHPIKCLFHFHGHESG